MYSRGKESKKSIIIFSTPFIVVFFRVWGEKIRFKFSFQLTVTRFSFILYFLTLVPSANFREIVKLLYQEVEGEEKKRHGWWKIYTHKMFIEF